MDEEITYIVFIGEDPEPLQKYLRSFQHRELEEVSHCAGGDRVFRPKIWMGAFSDLDDVAFSERFEGQGQLFVSSEGLFVEATNLYGF